MEFKVGDKVRMISNHPSHGFGDVKFGDIGKVSSVGTEALYVDFDRHAGWWASEDDVEKISDNQSIHVSK